MAAFLGVVPRVVVEGRGVVWADLRGLPGSRTAATLLALAADLAPGDVVWAGFAAVPIVAEVAARRGCAVGGATAGIDSALSVVDPGREREFLAPLPLSLLVSAACLPGASPRSGGRTSRSRGGGVGPYQQLLALFDGVGLRTCGELAALELAAVEVRFGAEGVRLWRLARGDDRRRLFSPIPPERPHASLDFIDYQVTDPERLVFTINALLGSVTSALRRRGEQGRSLLLSLALAGGGVWQRTLRPARPTASREVWLRLARRVLERTALPDAVVGVAIEVEATEPAAVRQGDLFDRGFATAGAVEAALARLLERQGEIVVSPRHTGHPLPERRVEWDVVDPFAQLSEAEERRARVGGRGRPPGATPGGRGRERRDGGVAVPEGASLSLHLLAEPQPIDVETGVMETGSVCEVPIRYRDRGGWKRVLTASGPDRISGGQWEEPYAREYFRCVTERGELVWLFHDPRQGIWFLHGWWG